MSKPASARLRIQELLRWLIIIPLAVWFVLIGYGILSFMLAGPIKALMRPWQIPEFERQHAIWESSGITHYRMTIRQLNLVMVFCTPATLEVADNQVVKFEPNETYAEMWELCHDANIYQDLTVDWLYELARGYLYEGSNGTSIEIRYDERYGIPVHVVVENPRMSEAPNFTIADFQVLDDSP